MPSWWYVSNGARKGPVSDDELNRMFGSGALTANSLLWKSGMQSWDSAIKIAELNALINSLPPELPAQEKRSWRRTNWKLVFLAFLAIQAVSFVVAFFFGAAQNWVGVIVSSWIILIIGLTVVGCILPEGRWVNMTVVAFLCWVSSLYLVAFSIPFSRWALSAVWYAAFVGASGIVSLLITALIKWFRAS